MSTHTKPPITLATLQDATLQEVFNQVANHLLAQGRRSIQRPGSNICAFRGYMGLKCGAGCLISDKEYSPDMEMDWASLVQDGYAPSKFQEEISELQKIHDNRIIKDWKSGLREFAEARNLTLPECLK